MHSTSTGSRYVSLDLHLPGHRPIRQGGDAIIAPGYANSIYLTREVERWFVELRDPMFRYLRTLGCQFWMAEEITQEAFLRLHNGLQTGLVVNDVRAWLFRVAINLWIDSWREQQRYGTPRRDDSGVADPADCDSGFDPEQQAIAAEQMQRIEASIARLPRLQRECLRLRLQGRRYREIAAELDISMSAAVDFIRHGTLRLKKALAD